MGLAFHNHHDVKGAFPSGGLSWAANRVMLNTGVPADFRAQTWGWGYQILPFVEQFNLWMTPQGPTAPGGDVAVASVPLKLFICPSLRGPTIFSYSQATWGSVSGGKRAMTDYVGNGGSWGTYDAFNSPSNSLDGPIVPSISGSGRLTTFSTITKGTSNTLLIGEKYVDVVIATTEPDCNDDQGWTDGWDNDMICFAQGGGPSSGPIYPPQPNGKVGTCGLIFGGPHTAGIQVVLCDGSVRSVTFSVDPNAWLIFCKAIGSGTLDWSSF
jgi:hypothetical protein